MYHSRLARGKHRRVVGSTQSVIGDDVTTTTIIRSYSRDTDPLSEYNNNNTTIRHHYRILNR
jgi:hypothetical protein